MKTNLLFWKLTTTIMTIGCVSLVVFSSFKSKSEKNLQPGENPAIIGDRAEAKELYQNFLRQYPDKEFDERGGYIGKSTMVALLSKMTNAEDTMVYYYFGRTIDAKNLIMVFNNPYYNNLDETPKFKTISPYCPPTCNTELNDYLTK